MRLSTWTKLGYGVGHVLNDLCSAVWFTYALVFYNFVVGLNDVDAGVILLIGQIADGVATPLVGLISDRGPTTGVKYGKRKTWHLIGTLGVICSVPFMFSPCLGCGESSSVIKMTYYGAFVVLFQCCWAMVQISHLSLAPDLTPNQNERTQLLSIRTTFAVLSNMTVYSVAWGVLAVDTSNSSSLSYSDMKEFQIIVYSVCVVGGMTSLIFHCIVKETDQEESLISSENQTERTPIKKLFQRFSLYQVAILYLSARLYGNMIQSLIPLYIHKVLQLSSQNIAIVPFVMYISSFLTSFVTGPMNEHLGRKVTFTFGGVVALIGTIWVWFGSGYVYSTYLIYLVAILLGSAQCTFLVTSLAIIADLIGNDIGNGAFIYGIMSFTDKLSSGAAIMGVQGLEPYGGAKYYQIATVAVCGISALIGTLVTLSLRQTTEHSENDEEESTNVVET